MAERAKANRAKKKRGRKDNGTTPGAGHNSEALQEITDRWLPKIRSARANYDKKAEAARTAKGQLGQVMEAAVADGCNLRGLKQGLEIERRDVNEVIAEQEQISRVLQSSGSTLVTEHLLFPLPKMVKPKNPYLLGQADGKAGKAKEPPGEPGSEVHDLYCQGWDSGQQKNIDKLRGDHASAN